MRAHKRFSIDCVSVSHLHILHLRSDNILNNSLLKEQPTNKCVFVGVHYIPTSNGLIVACFIREGRKVKSWLPTNDKFLYTF